ncbi:uncharacterized protein N7479_009435 [Penicillium vulpinum]|uniref:Putative gamma-glutamylcyclotransferase n=1 Tax=Penicillium vulpinum TaxID=29845 RepID=A0A1V6R464_9EURO|nr:uncharacterized protein N7479_009435 [Penicillium vulpinum]KAJ5951022.1 hypothetical protein N7479_009435 [Penicillium vulpinum]OQD96235.1 hypothetical protein PENVUL_c094G07743 [Penicillium vulpinum]
MSQHAQEQEVAVRAPDYLTNIKGDLCELPPEYPVYYFFYGTLTAPATLQRIIDLSEEPKMRKAKLIGYALAKWGDYPALIDGKSEQEISGYAYIVQTGEEAQKLACYETNAYKEAHCLIYFVDSEKPTEIPGKTFVYAGDANALLEQRFDRKLWLHQMAGKLV